MWNRAVVALPLVLAAICFAIAALLSVNPVNDLGFGLDMTGTPIYDTAAHAQIACGTDNVYFKTSAGAGWVCGED